MGKRGPKPALTLDRIADAGIAVADAEGLAAVSMQRVAAELGYTKMSLYRYLPGKAELVGAMVERGIGAPPDISAMSWRPALATWAEVLLARYVGHLWCLEAVAAPDRPVGPNELDWMERALHVMPPGLTGAEKLDTVATLAGHARMIAGQSTESRLAAAIETALRSRPDRYPSVAAAIGEVAMKGGADGAFTFGLARILDGLEALVRERSREGQAQV